VRALLTKEPLKSIHQFIHAPATLLGFAQSLGILPRMRIIGIDPGLQLTGYGVIDYQPIRPALIDGGVIRLKPKDSIADRLVELERELDELFEEHQPQVCAVEQVYSHYAHPRTAILMGHARGVILLAARRRGLRVEQYAANRIKQSLTGHGHASKPQMQRAIQSQWNLATRPEPPDVADALAVALCCGQALNGLLIEKADPHRRPRPRRAGRDNGFAALLAARGYSVREVRR
jgi:crossover junction endodeoxyribonuclease RuvC